MFNWFNMKKKSLPQQVLENTDNIEKLFDNELADITQLNFKQDEEESLVYENGVAKFKGKTTIIRDENAENVSVYSEMEFKVSSGDDDVVIDAGEDNATLEIHLDNETRNKINRALLTPLSTPSEREFVMIGTNNSQEMVKESELNLSNYVRANMYSRPTLEEPGTPVKMTLARSVTYNGEKFTVTDGKVIIGSGVSCVEVSAKSSIYFNEVGNCRLLIYKNGVILNESICYCDTRYRYGYCIISPFYLNVTEGDTLELWWDASATSGITLSNSYPGGSNENFATYLDVKVVK